MKNIYLVGGGGHCLSCIDVIQLTKKFSIKGIIDDNKTDFEIKDFQVIGTDTILKSIIADDALFLITIGQIKTPKTRIKIFDKLKELDANLASIISPSSYLSAYSFIDEGTIMMHGSIVNAGSQIGKNCIINTIALIEHNSVIGNHCHISTGAIINGGCKIGEGTFIGSQSVIKEGINIGTNCIVGAGCTVLNDLPDNTIYKN